MPRGREIVYPGRVKYWQLDFFSERRDLLKKGSKGRSHPRHVVGKPRHRIDPAGDEVQKIEHPIVLKPLRYADVVFKESPEVSWLCSFIVIRTPSKKPSPTASRIASKTIRPKRIRFSRVPPYLSAR